MSTGPRGAKRGWLPPLGRSTWYLAIAAAAVLGLTAGGVALVAGSGGGPSHEAEPDCGLINCGVSVPRPGATISTQSHIGRAHTAESHRPSAPAQAPPASSAPVQGSTPTVAAANVSVIFSSDQNRRDFDHFQEQMTLLNNGGSPVSGWTVQLTLPGDGVDSVEIPSGWDGVPFEHWQFSGDTLTISADSRSETLGPGAPLSLSIHGQGNTASPTGCTFNGSACPVQQDQQPEQPGQFGGQQAPQTGQPGSDQPDRRSWPQAGQGPWGGQPLQ
jgi:hypothetical protein